VELEEHGVRGDRRYYVIDGEGDLAHAKRVPKLLSVQATVADGCLALHFPDGTTVEADVELGEPVETLFYRRPVMSRFVLGPWNDALSEFAGKPLHLARTEREGDGHDRGQKAGASVVSTKSLRALGDAAGSPEPVDGRRFRMTIGVDGVGAHAEDSWIGSRVRVGGAVILVQDKVGRCATTTLDPDRGVPDFDTLRAIAAYRGDVPSPEKLPFGVWAGVVAPGPVAVGDPVELIP
jgi:uncharacterized protein YcbX